MLFHRQPAGAYNSDDGSGREQKMTAETAINADTRRDLYLDRRIVTVTPEKIDIHPARSIIFLPLFGLLLGITLFPVVYFFGDSLPLWLLVGITFAGIVLVPVSGMGLVYSIAGAHVVIDTNKQSAVLQQGYLGMGVGTQELIPFHKIDYIKVEDVIPSDDRGHQQDFAQYEISIVKISGKVIPLGSVTVARSDANHGLEHAREVAGLVAKMTGTRLEAMDRHEVQRESA
jgi:hypothetical protein